MSTSISIEKLTQLLNEYKKSLPAGLGLVLFGIGKKDLNYCINFLEKHLKEEGFNYNEIKSTEKLAQILLEINRDIIIENNGFYFDGKDKNIVKLDDGRYIYFNFGKYKPNLNFLINEDFLLKGIKYEKDDELKKQFNLKYSGSMFFLKGKFFISKKGSKFFDLTSQEKPHVLVKIAWGGAFNTSRGIEKEDIPKEALHFRKARSNGGGLGNDYLVLPKDFRMTYSIDDFWPACFHQAGFLFFYKRKRHLT